MKAMSTNRMEAFSDGVLAIIITIMVLEFKAPEEATFSALLHLIPTFLSYLISFIYVAIYWNNHHHLLHITKKVNGGILWANMHLLFWLSLIPFVTSWVNEAHEAAAPVAMYGIVLFMSAVAYSILQQTIITHHKGDLTLTNILGKHIKEKLSLALYLTGVIFAFYSTWLALTCYVMVAILWVIPNRRIENTPE